MPHWATGDDAPTSYFGTVMQDVDFKPDHKLLKKCPSCQQHWQIDAWDKYQKGICIKIDDVDNWQTFDDQSFRLEQITENYGGVSDKPCTWAGCSRHALVNLAFCAECAQKKS